MLKKIAILGPESTGKSQLTEELAAFYNTIYAPEFARNYIAGLGRPYNKNDLLYIAKKQVESIKLTSVKANDYLFSDTELIVIKIWSKFKYKTVHPWIENEIKKQNFDLYLLTDIDLEWEFDPLREHPNQRESLLKLYEKELLKQKLPFVKISGQGKMRTLNAIKAIDDFFK
ncbi:MAG: ATP-binding protein [Bacteroidales bacterium]|nr:ATP-binding protein [Bacteroidales bacterium]